MYYVNENIRDCVRVYPEQGRRPYLRLDMNENPEGLPKAFVDSVLAEITPEYLSTLFNKEVGINFSTFLKRFRISQAKRLLKGTDDKIYSIALQVGYNDPKYFNRVFKEEMGISPGDYRQNN